MLGPWAEQGSIELCTATKCVTEGYGILELVDHLCQIRLDQSVVCQMLSACSIDLFFGNYFFSLESIFCELRLEDAEEPGDHPCLELIREDPHR